jgi:8-oxo-dGTP diphosphatase
VTGSRTIEVVAGSIRDEAGRVLLVRKRGTAAFMHSGGKRCRDDGHVLPLARIGLVNRAVWRP